LPEIGKKIASKANRAGGADRFADPAVHTSLEVALALLTYYAQLLPDIALASVKAAKHPDAHTRSLRPTVPGIGQILRRVLLDARHEVARFPPVQACVSYGRLGTCAQEAAGNRLGTAGKTIGNAHLTGAFSAAAALCLRNHPAGPCSGARVEQKHGQGQALTILAPKLARAVYDLLKRTTAFDREPFLQGAGSSVDTERPR
jgi:hypothetical protein